MTKGAAQAAGTFLTDVKELRRRARAHMDRGAVTDGYEADRTTVLARLNTSLATELLCARRYRRHYAMASGIHAPAVAAECLRLLEEILAVEEEHAEDLQALIRTA